MAEITREQIEELRGLLTRATRGPWERQTLEPTTLGYEWIDAPSGRYVAICRGLLKKDKGGHAILSPELDEITANTALIAAMRNALPALLDIAETAIRNLEQSKGGDAIATIQSRPATSPGVTAGASKIEELCKRLKQLHYMLPAALGWTVEERDAPVEAADLIRRLVAERDEAREERDIWRSVFPDIAPESVVPDRSLLESRATAAEAEAARLRAENEALNDGSQTAVIVTNWFDLAKELGIPKGGSLFETVIELRDRAHAALEGKSDG